ncbi:MAG: metallophosphoesterase family protein [Ruminococcaceae bacterium]|nr:metallophosphoesterase family protein [Oscillospiraceae bacterium]
MKKSIKIISFILAVIMLMSISVFAESGYAHTDEDLNLFYPKWQSIQADNTVISLTPGKNQGEINFCWLSETENEEFRISENSTMSEAKKLEVIQLDAIDGLISNNVSATNLEEGKTYYYTYTENGVMSSPESFTVQNDENFTVLYISDAQIGRSGDEAKEEVLVRDTCGWNFTVDKMMKKYPDAAFLISGGDQFQSPDSLVQMKAYLSPEELRSLPVANTIGNHDDDSTLYGDIFNNPNEVFELFKSEAGTGYFYTYGDVLFITINSENTSLTDTKRVISNAVKAHPDKKWRVVTMHRNPYSASLSDEDFSDIRLLFSSLYDCYDIDLVLSGHDHLYSRTKVMYGGKASDEGTVYLQTSSASGSNYDPLPEETASFIVSSFDTRVPTYTALTFGEETISVSTYRTDTDEVVDSFEVEDNVSDSEANIFTILIALIRTLFSMIF